MFPAWPEKKVSHYEGSSMLMWHAKETGFGNRGFKTTQPQKKEKKEKKEEKGGNRLVFSSE